MSTARSPAVVTGESSIEFELARECANGLDLIIAADRLLVLGS